ASASGAAPAGPGAAAQAAGGDQTIDTSALPKPRAGLWQNVVDDGDGHPATMSICRSGNLPSVTRPKNCTQVSFKRTITGQIVADIDCGSTNRGLHITMHSVTSGDLQSHAVADMTMTMQMKGQPARVTKTHTESRYVGPCPAGMKPDVVEDSSERGPTG
ncbi:MAG: DUF3617 domain-containing protein, partial [Caulobacteraceae bacterium]